MGTEFDVADRKEGFYGATDADSDMRSRVVAARFWVDVEGWG